MGKHKRAFGIGDQISQCSLTESEKTVGCSSIGLEGCRDKQDEGVSLLCTVL